jgi:UDP-N-acetyl-2-amino-2-deoxyglucuronate dehydrogenase
MALTHDERSQFVAVIDPVPERAQQFGDEFGTQAYADLEQALSEQRVEMVSVCTPHPTHADVVVLAARMGVHALVEKPLAPNLEDCDRAIAAATEARVKLGMISQRRLYPPVVRMRQAIEAGKIGEPILATLNVLGWRDRAYYESAAWRGTWLGEGGGVLVNQTPHQLDLMQWLMGPIDELYGMWDNLNHPYIEVEDSAIAVLRFRTGALGSLTLSNSQRPGMYGKIHIHGSNGASVGAQTEGGSPFIAGVSTTAEPPINDLWTIAGEEHQLDEWQAVDRAATVDVMTHYHRLQISDFLQAIVDDRPPGVDGNEGRKVVEIISAIYRSQRDHRPIRFPLRAESGTTDYDGRRSYVPLTRRRSADG